jgi:hypothetical protein
MSDVRFCGSKLPHPLIATESTMLLVFKSDASVQRKVSFSYLIIKNETNGLCTFSGEWQANIVMFSHPFMTCLLKEGCSVFSNWSPRALHVFIDGLKMAFAGLHGGTRDSVRGPPGSNRNTKPNFQVKNKQTDSGPNVHEQCMGGTDASEKPGRKFCKVLSLYNIHLFEYFSLLVT